MPAAKKQPLARPKRKIVSPQRRALTPAHRRFQIHQEHFSQLFAVFKIRRRTPWPRHIIMSFKRQGRSAHLLRSTTTSGRNSISEIDTAFRISFNVLEIADELERLAERFLAV